MKKNIFTTILLCSFSLPLFSQVVNQGILRILTPTDSLYIKNDFTNKTGGVINNFGVLICALNLTNETGATLKGSGDYYVGRHWANAGTFTANNSVVTFNSSQPGSIVNGSQHFNRVVFQKFNKNITLTENLFIDDRMSFAGPGGHVILGNFNLVLGSSALPIGTPTATRHVVTDGTGALIKNTLGNTTYTFPVSTTTSTYNMLKVRNTGTADHLGVRCLDRMYTGGGSGTAFLNTPDVSWQVTEAIAGGSVLNIAALWYGADEQGTFNRTSCALLRHDGTGWDSAPQGAATGANPYSRLRNGFAGTGYFGVATGTPSAAPPVPPGTALTVPPVEDYLYVYPNPASDVVWMDFSTDAATSRLLVFDAAGSLLSESTPGAQTELFDVSALTPGWYVVQLQSTAGKNLTARFAVVR